MKRWWWIAGLAIVLGGCAIDPPTSRIVDVKCYSFGALVYEHDGVVAKDTTFSTAYVYQDSTFYAGREGTVCVEENRR